MSCWTEKTWIYFAQLSIYRRNWLWKKKTRKKWFVFFIILLIFALNFYFISKLQLQILPKLNKLLLLPDSQLLFSVLTLLYELSTEQQVREQMVEIIPILVELMKSEVTLEICIKLLYQASFEEKCRIMISKTPAIPMVSSFLVFHFEIFLAHFFCFS